MRKITIFLSVVLVAMLAMVGCTNKIKRSPKEIQKKVVVNLRTDPKELNSIFADNAESNVIMGHIFEGLTRLDKNQNVVPGVAKSWYVSEDKLTYTFYLRGGRWSDGSRITAMDFEFALKEVLNPQNESKCASKLYLIKNAKSYNLSNGQRDDVGVIAKSDYVLEITLEKSCPYLLHLLANPSFMPIKREFYERQQGEYAKTEFNLIFNGPWILDEWNRGESIKLRKNVYYWNRNNIKLDEIEFLISDDDELLFNMFKAHDLDIIDVKGEYLKSLYMSGYKIKKCLDGQTVYLEFNMKKDLMQSSDVRKAITYVIDREELCDKVSGEVNVPAKLFTNPVVKYANNMSAIKFRPTKQQCIKMAKEIFDNELGRLGKDTSLSLLTKNNEFWLKEAQYYKDCIENYWGITVNILSAIDTEEFEKYKAMGVDIVVDSIKPNYDSPITYLEKLGKGGSTTYSSPEYDALMDQGLFYLNKKESIDIFDKMEAIIADDIPIYPLYYVRINYVVQHNLKGVVRGPFKNMDLYYAHY
ncbi:MAG: peptide ABC transporter substrate-binding protein [Clostridiales bacterium]|nr:peptide ABC transporter substrate-binding protein [Clostridiales bacterium]